jgi:two-component system sensor histidine kinase UhpB
MRIFLSFLFMCLFTVALAQKADSIKIALSKTKTDSTKTLLFSALADELAKSNAKEAVEQAHSGLTLARRIDFDKGIFENSFSLASAFQGQSLFDSAVLYFHQALNAAEERDDVSGQAEVCSGLGHSFMRKSMFDSSRYYLEKGLLLAKKITNYRIEAGIYNNYGNVYLEESNYQKALDYFVQAAKLYENPLNDEKGQCLALSNIGNIEYRLGNYDQALDYANQSMAIAQRKSFTSSIGYAHKLLGRIYRKQKKYDSALVEYKKGQKLYVKLGDVRSAAEILQNIGNIYFDKEQHREALTNYQESLRLAKSISVKPLIAYAYSAIGQANAVLKRNDEALLYLDSARITAQVLGNAYLLMDTYDAISSVYEAKGDFKKALSVHQQLEQLKDSITQSENRQLAEETQAKYELEKKEAQITLLTKDQELKTLALGRQRAIQIGSAVALLLVIIIALLLVNRYRVLNRAKRLAEIEQVRNTIARDLHDDIGSTLSTINIISNLAMRENVNGNNHHLSRIAEQSSKMMESMTDMVWSINPINDSIEKVMVKMKVFATEILEPKDIKVRFFGEDSLNGLSLDAEKRKNLFLIFKEAVNNAAKYSEATEVNIALRQSEGKLTMSVHDNGKGFIEANIKTGNGLANLKSRANSMHAELDLYAAENKGTRIELVLPIT